MMMLTNRGRAYNDVFMEHYRMVYLGASVTAINETSRGIEQKVFRQVRDTVWDQTWDAVSDGVIR